MTVELYLLVYIGLGALLGEHFHPEGPMSVRVGWLWLWLACLLLLAIETAVDATGDER